MCNDSITTALLVSVLVFLVISPPPPYMTNLVLTKSSWSAMQNVPSGLGVKSMNGMGSIFCDLKIRFSPKIQI